MLNYRANGKFLLTGEYAITQGAKGLAVPTRFGQTLNYKPNNEDRSIKWIALDSSGNEWFKLEIDLTLSVYESTDQGIAEVLLPQLKIVKTITSLLDTPCIITTSLEFAREWGLGSSSTLASLLAQLSGANAMAEFRQMHKGSGYDIACATNDGPIIYHLDQGNPVVQKTTLPFEFLHDIGFIYTGHKQLTSESLKLVQSNPFSANQIEEINALTAAFVEAKTILELEKVIDEHENLISSHLGLEKIKDQIFEGYPGSIKSLGGWGGDFVLVTRLAANKKLLRNLGFKTIFPFKTMVLSTGH
jgi:mevalonate kinase